jgi:chitin synthase
MTDSIPEFISQRRRWLNGAFFAAVYSIVNVKQLWKTDHSLARKILLQIESVYQLLQLIFTYFGLVSSLLLKYQNSWLTTIGKLLPSFLLHCGFSYR